MGGGSAAETWMPRATLEASGYFGELLVHWDELSESYTDAMHAAEMGKYREWVATGRPASKLLFPRDPRYAQHRPSNAYNGVLNPIIGYGIRGVVWYQGERNAGRAYQYRILFPLLIQTWRERWGQGDFPFYWAQLADFRNEVPDPRESSWAELREAQTMTLKLPNTGQAVIIDAGEQRDIHPRNKQVVANRLSRIALARDYEYPIAYQSPQFASMQVEGDSVLLSFDYVSEEGLCAFDTKKVLGFAIAGEDRNFVWADAKIVGKDRIRLRAEGVSSPIAVRYAWANNPVANVEDRNGLLLTPFRTDDWPGITVDQVK